MPLSLRLLLMCASILSFLFVVRRLKKTQIQLYDTIFWIVLAILFVVLSLFPVLAIKLAEFLGVESPVNLVYLIIIFILLGHCFIQSLRFSKLEDEFRSFVEDDALNRMEEQGKSEIDNDNEKNCSGL